VNDVPDALFELEFPPGTGVIDKTKDVFYYIPQDKGDLDRAIAEAARIVDGKIVGLDRLARPAMAELPAHTNRWIGLVWLFNLVLLWLLLAGAYRLRTRAARTSRRSG
jgi:hypothetical protein